MEPEMKTACVKAAAKLGIGLCLLTAVIGIRLVTISTDGVESGIRELKRLDAQIASEPASASAPVLDAEPPADDGIVSRLSAGIRERMPGSDSRSRDGDKLVSCYIGGRTQFMRADNCAMRGGKSTDVSLDR
jgi:hypothetical protein